MSIPSILIGLDSHGRITRWNNAAATTFSIDSSAALGRSLEDCGVQWLQPELHSEIPRWLAATSFFSQDFQFKKSDTDLRFLDIGIQPIPGQDGASGLILTGNDVTHFKFLEGQLRQAQKLEAVGQLAAGIAHEINTPLQYTGDNVKFFKESWSNVANLLRMLRRVLEKSNEGHTPIQAAGDLHTAWRNSDADFLLDETSSAIDQATEGLERISNIVRAMREFSHPGSKGKAMVDINHAINITSTVARNEWKYASQLVTQFDPNLTPVPCHSGEINQVLLNLIVNAAQSISENPARVPTEKGTITISTTQLPDAVQIAIQDTGPGIPENIRSRIFEPFFTTKQPGKGTGQGLALAHAVIVQQHHGQIWFESKTGVGTTFYIRLPIGEDPESVI
jgi:signal transduction histidine kinase